MEIRGDICRSCKYYAMSIGCCDYAEMTGKLRTVENHKIRVDLKEDECDKYTKSERRENVNWAVEKRANWCKVKGCY